MGEAQRVREAKSEESEKQHRILMEWVPRGILIWMVRQGQGKGMQHTRMVRRTTKALMLDDDFGYLEDGTVNLLQTPGVQLLAINPLPPIVQALVKDGLIERASDIEMITVRVNERLDCPDRIVSLTTSQIEFLLKLVEEVGLKNAFSERAADALGDMEDAKAGRYELPAEVDGQDAVALAAKANGRDEQSATGTEG